MSMRTILSLGLATALVAGLAFYSLQDEGAATAADTGSLFPELLDSINDVARLEIEGADGTVTIVRDGDTWGLEEKHGFPVDLEKVGAALRGVALLETVERKTSDPAKHAALGLEGVGEDSETTRIELDDASGARLAALLVGKPRSGRTGGDEVYVRRDGEPQTWLVAGKLDTSVDGGTWIDRKIAKIPRARIQAVQVEHSYGEVLRISKPDETATTFTVHDVPEGRELSYATVADGMANTLEWLTLDDVEPADALDLGADWTVKTTFWTFDGLVVEATLTETDEEVWARFEARTDADGPPFVAEADEAAADAPAEPSPEVVAEAAELNARFERWTYRLQSHSMTSLAKRMELLLKPLPEEEPEGGAEIENAPTDDVKLEDLLTPEQIRQINAEHGTDIPVPGDGDGDGGDADDGGR